MFKKLIILSIIVWYVIMSIHNCLCIWYHRIMYAAMPMPPVYRNGMETKMGKNGTLSFARRAAELTVGGVYLCVLYTICALLELFYSFIYSRFTYGIVCYGSAYQNQVQRLKNAINRALKIVFSSSDITPELLKRENLLDFDLAY